MPRKSNMSDAEFAVWFWSKVRRGPAPNDCWVWTGRLNHKGYGILHWHGARSAHRTAYILTNGPIPPGSGYHGTCVLHACDNAVCVRPDHLWLGSSAENMADKVSKGRQSKGEAHTVIMRRVAARGASNGAYTHPESRPSGEANAAAKLTALKATAIRVAYLDGRTKSQLAREYGVSRPAIASILSRQTWKHAE